jgi:hypothetical protein
MKGEMERSQVRILSLASVSVAQWLERLNPIPIFAWTLVFRGGPEVHGYLCTITPWAMFCSPKIRYEPEVFGYRL